MLVEHIRQQLINEFGVVRFDAWRGKDGLSQHTAEEIAERAVASIWPVLANHRDLLSEIVRLHGEGSLAPEVHEPKTW